MYHSFESFRTRFDYFLIWGNGMPFKDEILGMIRNDNKLKIVRMMDYKPKSIARFVRSVYSYDYAPFQHLKGKTRYLLRTDPDVSIIFLRNTDPQEVCRGEGPFRHIECERIKQLKDDIRNRYNPRMNGKRTEEHVVHASDNESQVDHLLKIVGYKNGIAYLKNDPNPILSLPYYISDFNSFSIRAIDTLQIYCNILRGNKESFWHEATHIEQTPHFACLQGDTTAYSDYIATFLGGPLTVDYSVGKLIALEKKLDYLEKPYSISYIFVKEYKPNQYLILDGVHRASILKSRGFERIAVAVME